MGGRTPNSVASSPQQLGLAVRAATYARGFTGLNGDVLLAAAMSPWMGIGIFDVLFNLYLIALGYSVAFVGMLAALSTAGQAAVPLVLTVKDPAPGNESNHVPWLVTGSGVALLGTPCGTRMPITDQRGRG